MSLLNKKGACSAGETKTGGLNYSLSTQRIVFAMRRPLWNGFETVLWIFYFYFFDISEA